MAVLAPPEHFREDDALMHVSDLKRTQPLSVDGSVRPLGGEVGAQLRFITPAHRGDGAALSQPAGWQRHWIDAARSATRGAWIAPANEAFTGVVSLTPRIAIDRYLDLLLAQVNLVRQEPRGFLALSADTLSVLDELRPINVRRLLILLRRAALRLGMTFVFEPNDAILRRVVQGAFESIMHQLFTRGAFAGDTADSSYQVVTDDTINTADDYDQGRFRVDLKVAPAWPMSFLTVRLVQEGERSTATEII
jgi:phage tail sheath protein FI